MPRPRKNIVLDFAAIDQALNSGGKCDPKSSSKSITATASSSNPVAMAESSECLCRHKPPSSRPEFFTMGSCDPAF